MLWQIRVIYAEVGFEMAPRSPLPVKSSTPEVTRSIDWPQHKCFNNSYHSPEEEDNISDSDTEEEWKKEGMLSVPQTVYV